MIIYCSIFSGLQHVKTYECDDMICEFVILSDPKSD